MRSIVLLLVGLMMLMASPTMAAITFDQAGIGTCSGCTTVTVTMDAATTANGTIVVICSSQSTTRTISSISGGGTYAQRAIANTGNSTELWSTDAGASSSVSSISVTMSTSANTICTAGSYLGVAILGTTNTANGSGSNPTVSITTQDANNFVVGGHGVNSATDSTAGTGTLRKVSHAGTGGPAIGGSLVDNTNASATSVTVSVTHGAATWTAAALELRSTTGGGGGTTYPGWYGGGWQ